MNVHKLANGLCWEWCHWVSVRDLLPDGWLGVDGSGRKSCKVQEKEERAVGSWSAKTRIDKVTIALS